MQTLNLFRVTVGAAALGFARRALDEAIAFATTRKLGNAHARRQCRDPGQPRRHGDWRSTPRPCSSPAPPGSRTRARPTTAAPPPWPSSTPPKPRRRVIDQAVQLHGGLGVTRGVDGRRASTAKSARCASTKARPKCSARSSPATCSRKHAHEVAPPPRLAAAQGLFQRHRRAAAGLIFTAGVVGWDEQETLRRRHARRPVRPGPAQHPRDPRRGRRRSRASRPPDLLRHLDRRLSSPASPRSARRGRRSSGAHYPAMALVEVVRLVEPEALVEIEATAVVPE